MSQLMFKPSFKTYGDGYRAEYCQWVWQDQRVVAEIVRHTVIGGHGELTTHYEATMGHPRVGSVLLGSPTGENIIFPVGRGLFNTKFEDLTQHIEKMQAAYLREYRHFQGRDLGDYSWEPRAAGVKAKRWVKDRLKEVAA